MFSNTRISDKQNVFTQQYLGSTYTKNIPVHLELKYQVSS